MKKTRKVMVTLVLCLALMLQGTIAVFASDGNDHKNILQETYEMSLLEVAELYSITVDELLGLGENLENALDVANTEMQRLMANDQVARSRINANIAHTVTVPLSENLVLELKVSEKDTAPEDIFITASSLTTVRRTTTFTHRIYNIFGATIITLNSTGVFDLTHNSNGQITRSVPVDRWTSHQTGNLVLWSVVTTGGNQSAAMTTGAWVRNSFRGELRIGGNIGITINEFSINNTITTPANIRNSNTSVWG